MSLFTVSSSIRDHLSLPLQDEPVGLIRHQAAGADALSSAGARGYCCAEQGTTGSAVVTTYVSATVVGGREWRWNDAAWRAGGQETWMRADIRRGRDMVYCAGHCPSLGW